MTHITAVRLSGLLAFHFIRVAGRCNCCGKPLTTPEVRNCRGSVESPLIGEIDICVKCLVILLVKGAIAQNYAGLRKARSAGLELQGECNGCGSDDDNGCGLIGDRLRERVHSRS